MRGGGHGPFGGGPPAAKPLNTKATVRRLLGLLSRQKIILFFSDFYLMFLTICP
jgi:hypothetical protein